MSNKEKYVIFVYIVMVEQNVSLANNRAVAVRASEHALHYIEDEAIRASDHASQAYITELNSPP